LRDGTSGRWLKDLDAAHRALLQDTRRLTVHPADDSAELAAFGVPADVLADVTGADGAVVVVPLPVVRPRHALLVVAAKDEPARGQLQDLARRGGTALQSAVIYEERASLADTLRTALLPAPLPALPGVQLAACYRPAQEASQIGGDFYDVTPLPDNRWVLSIGDVCGKGVDAAVLTGQVRQSLRTALVMTDELPTALRFVNDAMLRGDGNTFVTLNLALLRPVGATVAVRLTSAGHPPPLLLRNGVVTPLIVRGTLVGMLPDVSFDVVDVVLEPEDVLVFYTDGGPEARGPSGLLGLQPLMDLLADSAGLTAQAVSERLLQRVLEHLDGAPHDDIAIVAVRCCPEARI
jgi:serine phosphatase RsbU (regulator of sigma subunit)